MTLTELTSLCRSQRKEKGLTQKQLAELIGVYQAHISRFESGKENFCTKILLTLFKALDLNIKP